MNETLEIARSTETVKVMEALTKMVENEKLTVEERVKAATIASIIYRDLIVSDVSLMGITADENTKKKLINHLMNHDGERGLH